MKGKLQAAKNALEECNRTNQNTGSALWISNYNVTDEEMNIIEESVLHKPEQIQLKALFYNNVPGCTMVFNRALMNKLRQMKLSDFRMHDILTLCVSLISGEVIYDDNPYVLYRQHATNVIGRYHKTYSLPKWMWDKVKIVLSKESFGYAKYARRVLEVFGDELDDNLKKEYELIASYKKGLSRFRLLSRPYTKDRFGRTSISIRMRILLGKV